MVFTRLQRSFFLSPFSLTGSPSRNQQSPVVFSTSVFQVLGMCAKQHGLTIPFLLFSSGVQLESISLGGDHWSRRLGMGRNWILEEILSPAIGKWRVRTTKVTIHLLKRKRSDFFFFLQCYFSFHLLHSLSLWLSLHYVMLWVKSCTVATAVVIQRHWLFGEVWGSLTNSCEIYLYIIIIIIKS